MPYGLIQPNTAEHPEYARCRPQRSMSGLAPIQHPRPSSDSPSPALSGQRYRSCAEYEGAHHLTPEQRAKDHDHDLLTKQLGWNQAVINKNDMRNGGMRASRGSKEDPKQGQCHGHEIPTGTRAAQCQPRGPHLRRIHFHGKITAGRLSPIFAPCGGTTMTPSAAASPRIMAASVWAHGDASPYTNR